MMRNYLPVNTCVQKTVWQLACGCAAIILLSLPAFSLASQAEPAAQPPVQVRLWGIAKGRGVYEKALLKAALNSIDDPHFSYRLTFLSRPLGSLRGREEIAKGKLINIYSSNYHTDHYSKSGRIITIPIPLMNGILGYRSVVVRQTDVAKYALKRPSRVLKKALIGQGSYWSDVAVYRYNGYRVDDSGRLSLLLPMLAHRRFDAVSLGYSEAPKMLANSSEAEQLTIVPNLLVYYPLPMVFQVSGNNPKLAKRVQQGLKNIQRNGAMEKIFKRFYGGSLERIKHYKGALVILKHPPKMPTMGLDKPLLLPGFH